MINQQLLDFIKKQTQQGLTKEKISSELLANGWTTQDIEEGFKTIVPSPSGVPIAPYNNINVSSNITQPSKPKKHLLRKVIKIIISISIITWFMFEAINFSEYVSIKNMNGNQFGMPGPIYQPVVVQNFYKLFPSLNPNKGGGVYKPVIYLYPTSTEKIQVQLDYKGTFIADYPTYNTEQKGWTVTASPDGKIINSDGKEYSYLFWEGKPTITTNYDLSAGFIIKGEDTIEFLQNTLSKMGLTPKEYNEFIVYWYPKMKDNKYNLIHFAGTEYTDTAPLIITPKPDSMLRIFMVFKPLNKIIDINPQELKSFIRNGFTVVEWGGTELEK